MFQMHDTAHLYSRYSSAIQPYFRHMILVTGATGLVGSHLLYALLKRGESVRASKRTGSNLADVDLVFSFYGDDAKSLLKKVEWMEADLMNPASVDDLFEGGITQVFHCAALVSFLPRDRQRMIAENAQTTANLVNAALACGVNHFVHVSSVAAIGRDADKSKEINENTQWKNGPDNSVYAISKYTAENEVWRGIEEGLQAAIVNPTIILGPGNKHRSSNTIFKTFTKYFPLYTAGSNGFTDVRDVVDAMLLLADVQKSGERYILAGTNKSYREVFEAIAKEAGVKPPHLKTPPLLAQIIWRFEHVRSLLTGSKPLITRETARSAIHSYVYSSKKFKSEFGFSFRPLEQTLKESVGFYLK